MRAPEPCRRPDLPAPGPERRVQSGCLRADPACVAPVPVSRSPCRTARRRPLVAVLAVTVLAVGAPSASAAPGSGVGASSSGPSGGSASSVTAPSDLAGAQAAAEAAARRVDALRERYLLLTRQGTAEATRLMQAFAEQALVNGRHNADQAALTRAEEVRATAIRAVYADGGSLGLLGSVLSSPSPDDALWRIGTARRIQDGLLRGAVDGERTAAARESRSRTAEDAAAQADAALAHELAAVQDDVAAADGTLRQAQAELDRLSTQERRLAAAQDAARRLAEARAAAAAARLGTTPVSALVIPPDYLAAYRAAATTCPGMDWTLLAAVGQIESGHGRNNGPSSAGAIGPMQFMPATFAQYAVDGNHDGVTDAWDYQDAISTAAAYLCASGASGGSPDGIRAALFAYNHAQWYVDLVLAAQRAIIAANP